MDPRPVYPILAELTKGFRRSLQKTIAWAVDGLLRHASVSLPHPLTTWGGVCYPGGVDNSRCPGQVPRKGRIGKSGANPPRWRHCERGSSAGAHCRPEAMGRARPLLLTPRARRPA
jgi:hypothetical protein